MNPASSLFGIHRDQLAEAFVAWKEPRWRVDQVLDWAYAKRAPGWDAMTNLPRALRARLAERFHLQLPELVQVQGAADTTRKFLWRLEDRSLIESVLIPSNPALYGDQADRRTLCLSTQVGCAYGCRFCASGLEGWKRNLTIHEIVGQVLAVERRVHAESRPPGDTPAAVTDDRGVDNLVVMGMGEPLANYDALMAALRVLNAPWGAGIGARKITVSTSGLVPQIRRLAAEPEQFRLAISLHGATNAVRDRIMPINRKYPVEALAAACEEYVRLKGRMITLEYILLAGVNDGREQAAPLAALARRLHAKVNLIPYNVVEGLEWTRPEDRQCEAFAHALRDLGTLTTLRLEKGHDIDAACGQLRLKTERAEAA